MKTIPYYGGKMRLAPKLIASFLPHINYVEPFAGAAAVLMAKEPVQREVINDLNGDVVNFWRTLRDHSDALHDKLAATPYSRVEYKLAAVPDDDPLEQARRFVVRSYMSFSASQNAGYGPCSPRKGGFRASNFATAVDELLPRLAQRLRKVEIESMDGIDLIRRWRVPETALYVDPPYMAETRTAQKQYTVEADDAEYHKRLIDELRIFPGQVILSGYMSDLYRPLQYEGWELQTFDMVNPSSLRRDSSARRTECVWIKK